MKKIKLLLALAFLIAITTTVKAQVVGYTVKALLELKTDSIFIIKQDTFRIIGSSDGQILQKVAGQWINATPSYLDSLIKSEDVFFLNPSNDSLSSQLSIKTFVLQSISDSVGNRSASDITMDTLDVPTY